LRASTPDGTTVECQRCVAPVGARKSVRFENRPRPLITLKRFARPALKYRAHRHHSTSTRDLPLAPADAVDIGAAQAPLTPSSSTSAQLDDERHYCRVRVPATALAPQDDCARTSPASEQSGAASRAHAVPQASGGTRTGPSTARSPVSAPVWRVAAGRAESAGKRSPQARGLAHGCEWRELPTASMQSVSREQSCERAEAEGGLLSI
jgi:hypothetical protein